MWLTIWHASQELTQDPDKLSQQGTESKVPKGLETEMPAKETVSQSRKSQLQ